jgi:hypothetical protein
MLNRFIIARVSVRGLIWTGNEYIYFASRKLHVTGQEFELEKFPEMGGGISVDGNDSVEK